jgi:hypothetical protein
MPSLIARYQPSESSFFLAIFKIFFLVTNVPGSRLLATILLISAFYCRFFALRLSPVQMLNHDVFEDVHSKMRLDITFASPYKRGLVDFLCFMLSLLDFQLFENAPSQKFL